MRSRLGRFVLFGLFVVVASPPVSAKDDPFGKERQGRLSDGLSRLSDAAERGERVTPRRFRGLSADGLEVRAVAELTDPDRRLAVEARVRALGGTVEGAAGAFVRVALPVRGLRTLAADPGVRIVREPFRPSAKAVTSEGAAAIHAPEFRARTGADGAGVRIAVLDAGFARARDLVGEELPEGVLATDFVLERLDSFEEVHGTACAEIVHDVAPGAELVLAGFEDEVGWAEEIDRLVGGGVRIISHSIGFDNLYPPDGNNYFTQRVDQAQAAGVLFVTAAGNETGNYYQGSWRDANSNNFLEFGPGTELLPIGAAAGGTTVALRWDDGFGASSHDYDLLVVTPAFLDDPRLSQDNPAIVAFSAGLQDGDDDPREVVDLEVDEDQILYAVIVHDPASPLLSSQRFWLYASAGVEPSFAAGSGTLSLPGDARGAVTVGAIAFDATGVEGFSSRGPTADGRVKPDVAGPDRVTTAAYEGEPFPGTSAATPHVAGAAALILSRSPGLSVAALRAALEQATTTLGRTKNNDVGYGLIDLNQVR